MVQWFRLPTTTILDKELIILKHIFFIRLMFFSILFLFCKLKGTSIKENEMINSVVRSPQQR